MTEMVDYKEGYRRYRKYHRNLQMFYRKPPVRDVTFLVLSLLTAAFFSFFAIKPSFKTIGGLIKEIEDKRMASEKLAQKINALSVAQGEYALIQSDLPKVYNVLPKKADFPKLAKQIEYLTGENNSSITALQIQGTRLFGEEKKKLSPLEFNLNITGEYKDLKKFLGDLESLDRIITVDGLTFSKKKRKKEAEAKFSLFLTIKAKGYYLP